MNKLRWAVLVLCLVGGADSLYLFLNTLSPSVQLICPSNSIINCGKVTSSPFSHVDGVPVALLGLLWFLALGGLSFAGPRYYQYTLLPLWMAGAVMIGYLVSAEVFFVHAICLYCTLAHTCALLLVIPVVKLTFAE